MPLSRKVKLVCSKCGYSKSVLVGDAINPSKLIQKCPKCGSLMLPSNKMESFSVFDKIKKFFKK